MYSTSMLIVDIHVHVDRRYMYIHVHVIKSRGYVLLMSCTVRASYGVRCRYVAACQVFVIMKQTLQNNRFHLHESYIYLDVREKCSATILVLAALDILKT